MFRKIVSMLEIQIRTVILFYPKTINNLGIYFNTIIIVSSYTNLKLDYINKLTVWSFVKILPKSKIFPILSTNIWFSLILGPGHFGKT